MLAMTAYHFPCKFTLGNIVYRYTLSQITHCELSPHGVRGQSLHLLHLLLLIKLRFRFD